MTIVLPDGTRLPTRTELLYRGKDMPFGAELDEHIAWLGVPTVNTAGAGHFKSHLPIPHVSLLGLLAADPQHLRQVPQAAQAMIEADYYPQTKIVDAQGHVLSRVTRDGDGFALAEVELADHPPKPSSPQPDFKLTPLAYATSDWLVPAFTIPLYRMGLRRQFGAHMAPVDLATRKWLVGVMIALLFGWLFGRFNRRG
jgi:hypothetical protein